MVLNVQTFSSLFISFPNLTPPLLLTTPIHKYSFHIFYFYHQINQNQRSCVLDMHLHFIDVCLMSNCLECLLAIWTLSKWWRLMLSGYSRSMVGLPASPCTRWARMCQLTSIIHWLLSGLCICTVHVTIWCEVSLSRRRRQNSVWTGKVTPNI